MEVSTVVPLSEYLRTSYRPDRDWIDGEVRERNWADGPHAVIQSYFTGLLARAEVTQQFRVMIELTLHTSATRYRVADVSLLRRSAPYESIPTVAPLLCIEVLSPEDGVSAMLEKIDDYLGLGVEMVWLADPRRRRVYEVDAGGGARWRC